MVDTQSYTSFNHKIALAEEGIVPLHLMCLSVGQISFTIAKHRLLNVQKKSEVYFVHYYGVWKVQEWHQYVTITKRRPGCCT